MNELSGGRRNLDEHSGGRKQVTEVGGEGWKEGEGLKKGEVGLEILFCR